MSLEKADLKEVLKRLSAKHRQELVQCPTCGSTNKSAAKLCCGDRWHEEEIPLAGGNWPMDHVPHNNC